MTVSDLLELVALAALVTALGLATGAVWVAVLVFAAAVWYVSWTWKLDASLHKKSLVKSVVYPVRKAMRKRRQARAAEKAARERARHRRNEIVIRVDGKS